jgi:poly-gamma-glutamate synthesis protein (capsule biosynthesis protein)
MNINVVGDFCINPKNLSKNLFSDGIVSIFSNADINIANLECPIIPRAKGKTEIMKTGPSLHTFNEVLNHLEQLNIHAVTLANNHILDYGENGLNNTILECKNRDIDVVGVGSNITEASKPLIIEKEGSRIAIVNFCENEWSIATNDTAGANPLDIIENVKQIKYARKFADIVLVIIHGGHEYYHLPSPRMVKQYRFLAEQGADIIIGHHPHVVGGYEVYKKVPIFYSLGNFIFTSSSKFESFYTGLILNIQFKHNKIDNWELIPSRQSFGDNIVSVIKDNEKDKILGDINRYSQIISNEKELNYHWNDWITKRRKDTLKIFSPLNIIPIPYVGAIFRRLGANKILLTRKYLSSVLNYIRCEALHDLSKEVIKSKLVNK